MTPLEQRAIDELHASDGKEGGRVDCCPRCWTRWLRLRLLEHLRGDAYWKELDRDDYAVLRRDVHPDRGLLDELARLVEAGRENVEMIGWAIESGRPLDDVLVILALLDVNARRVPRFPSLGAAARRCRLEASEGRC